MVPMGNSVDDSKEFSIIDLIIAFCRSKRFRKIETGVIIAIIVLLKEDSSSSDEGCVSGNSELLLGSGLRRTGAVQKASLILRKVSSCECDQMKETSFFVRSTRGRARSEKWGMN